METMNGSVQTNQMMEGPKDVEVKSKGAERE
jgi:hypothetical protein